MFAHNINYSPITHMKCMHVQQQQADWFLKEHPNGSMF